jgi:hypothetical protein
MPALTNRQCLIRSDWSARGPIPKSQKPSSKTKCPQYEEDHDNQAKDVNDLIHCVRPIGKFFGFSRPLMS